jgi:regulatory protein
MNVKLSDGSSFFIPKALVYAQNLYPGTCLSLKEIRDLQNRARQLKVRGKALSLLTRTPHSTQMLRQKLLRNFDRDSVEPVLQELTKQKLLDDPAYAELWLQSRLLRHPEGRTALFAGLFRHGVSRALAEEVLNRMFTEDVERETIHRLLEKLERLDLSPDELRSRLKKRTFRWSLIREVLDSGGE